MADPIPLRPARRLPEVAAVLDRVRADLEELVDAFGAVVVREVPEYAALGESSVREDVLPVTRRVLSTFLDSYIEGHVVTDADVRAIAASGRARLRMGVPLEAVLHAYRIAGRLLWDAVLAHLEPGDELLLGDIARRWMDFVDAASGHVAKGYVAESHRTLRQLDARRRELVEALLTADDPAEVAAVSLRFSTVLSPAYVPLLIAGGAAAANIDALLTTAPDGTLGGHRGEHVLLLVPERLTDLARLHRAAGESLLVWGRPAAPGRVLLEEVTHLESLIATARAEGHATGSYGPDDLLVEQLLLGNARVAGALRRRVAEMLNVRDPSGSLTTTLRHYLVCGSVPETARRDVIHPNTVGYRLGRVREITGLDPKVPADAVLLVLGLGLPQAE